MLCIISNHSDIHPIPVLVSYQLTPNFLAKAMLPTHLFVPNESTKEGANNSAITIGTEWENAEMKDRYSLTLSCPELAKDRLGDTTKHSRN